MKVIIEPRLAIRGQKIFEAAQKTYAFTFLTCLDENYEQQAIESSILALAEKSKTSASKKAEGLALVLGSKKFSEGFFIQLSKIVDASKLLIIRFGSGYDNIPLVLCKKLGFKVASTPAAAAKSVSELSFSLFFALAKNLFVNHASTEAAMPKSAYPRKGNLSSSQIGVSLPASKLRPAIQLSQKRLAVLGLGNIGRQVAKTAHYGLDMEVFAYVKYQAEEKPLKFLQYAGDDLKKVLCAADFISINLSLNNETRNLLGKKEFSWIPATALLVNTARSALVDDEALISALADGKLAGAALDVFTETTVRLYQQRLLPRNLGHKLLFSPHQGTNTHESSLAMAAQVIDTLHAFASKKSSLANFLC